MKKIAVVLSLVCLVVFAQAQNSTSKAKKAPNSKSSATAKTKTAEAKTKGANPEAKPAPQAVAAQPVAQPTKNEAAQQAPQNTVDPNAPEIKWENPTIDYGTINKGTSGEREFKFTNTGRSPLILSSCRGSCGCTVPVCPTEPIMPGQKGSIKVTYDTQRVGPFTKTVTVNSNAKTPTETLKITGTVNDPNPTPAPAPAPAQNQGH